MLEKDIEARLVRGVKALGGKAYKFVSPGNIGVPDRMIVLPGGKIIFAELKTDSGVLSAMQRAQIKQLQDLGADVRVLKGLDQVRAFLAGLKNQAEHARLHMTHKGGDAK